MLAGLASDVSLVYAPEAFGLQKAREAVCDYYLDQHVEVKPAQVCLTTSTSEAYSFLFRLLCDPGDEILIAQPGYPLFDFLADLDDLRLVTYPLFYDHGWQMEPEALEARITPRTRAIVVVHPNNPTGHYVSAADREKLDRVCQAHNLALIVDEVFLGYVLDDEIGNAVIPVASFASGDHAALTFVVSGLSKVAALPQMKASWLVTLGPATAQQEALARLELVADTFLSMNAPIQHALPGWLANRAAIQTQITLRTQSNLAMLDELLRQSGAVARLQVQAGWYAVLRVPAVGADDELALALAERWGVAVHPGHYYGFAGDGWLVVSLLPPADEFTTGIRAVLAACDERGR